MSFVVILDPLICHKTNHKLIVMAFDVPPPLFHTDT